MSKIIQSNGITFVNPSNREFAKSSFLFNVGAYGWHNYMVYEDHFESAFDELMDHLADHAPGLLANEEFNEAYNEAMKEGKTEEQAFEIASCDLMCGGNACEWICSWEVALYAENPTRQQIKALQKR